MKKEILEMFYKQGLPAVEKLKKIISGPLQGTGDFADIYIEDTAAKGYRLSERIISDISSSFVSGAGIRVVKGNNTGFSYTENLEEKYIGQCAADASRIAGSGKPLQTGDSEGKHNFYDCAASIDEAAAQKIDLLKRAEAKAFSLSPYVEKVEVMLVENIKKIFILNSTGAEAFDIRPLLRFSVSVVLNKNNRRERGSQGGGGRVGLSYFDDQKSPEQVAEEAVNQALVLLEAKPAPAGEMEVVLGAGESGILLHESIGHPLEADFNYRGSSAFSGMIGQKVAADQCTIIDQGDLPAYRGSLNVDDEGSDTGKTVLIEDGILRTYMFDLITGNFFKSPSLNGRRQSFRHAPMPRMTNTYMKAGKYSPEEIFKSVKKGVYAKSFSGGQVDISSGDFVFSVTEGYMIEAGKIAYPIKGATLIGSGPEILKRITMVGSDLVISDGKWTCGKEGQSVPVGVGIPTVKLSHITVGGTG
ncbi:MAG: metalloprotease TldD [Candidatus Aminicenantes bacterium]|nr:metalloprotease TldD [Candidatus Aminicenantes bacterium]